MTYKYKTSLTLGLLGLNSDHSVPLEIEYGVGKGYEATREQPAEGPSVHLNKITLTDITDGTRYRAHDWLWRILEGDQELTDELISEARAADECAADEHADAMRREMRL